MDFALTDEQKLIVDTVRTFVENELYPHEEEVERTGVVPRELGEEISQKVRDIGFFAPNISTEYGGGGLNTLEFTLLERELGRASMALTVFFALLNEAKLKRQELVAAARKQATVEELAGKIEGLIIPWSGSRRDS